MCVCVMMCDVLCVCCFMMCVSFCLFKLFLDMVIVCLLLVLVLDLRILKRCGDDYCCLWWMKSGCVGLCVCGWRWR